MAEFIRLKTDYEGMPAGAIIERNETTEHLVTAGMAGPTILSNPMLFRKAWESPDGRVYQPGEYAKLDSATAATLKEQGIVEDLTR
jgi:hypothetical protein